MFHFTITFFQNPVNCMFLHCQKEKHYLGSFMESNVMKHYIWRVKKLSIKPTAMASQIDYSDCTLKCRSLILKLATKVHISIWTVAYS